MSYKQHKNKTRNCSIVLLSNKLISSSGILCYFILFKKMLTK